jgi:acylphosphatase
VDIARELGLKGFVQNLEDGRVKVVAEGEDDHLEQFLKAIDIQNAIIHVNSISWGYSDGTSNFADFYKISGRNEVASRLDDGIEILKGILVAIKDMHADLGSKQDQTLCAIKDMHADLGCKIDDTRADIVGEVRELRKDINDGELVQMKKDIAEIKTKLKLEP